MALASIGNDLDSWFPTEPHRMSGEFRKRRPWYLRMLMLELTLSGAIRVPPLVESNRGLISDISRDTDSASERKMTFGLHAARGPIPFFTHCERIDTSM
jgi:hypothetical protein